MSKSGTGWEASGQTVGREVGREQFILWWDGKRGNINQKRERSGNIGRERKYRNRSRSRTVPDHFSRPDLYRAEPWKTHGSALHWSKPSSIRVSVHKWSHFRSLCLRRSMALSNLVVFLVFLPQPPGSFMCTSLSRDGRIYAGATSKWRSGRPFSCYS